MNDFLGFLTFLFFFSVLVFTVVFVGSLAVGAAALVLRKMGLLDD